jgi:hypothetical protein
MRAPIVGLVVWLGFVGTWLGSGVIFERRSTKWVGDQCRAGGSLAGHHGGDHRLHGLGCRQQRLRLKTTGSSL